MPLTLEQQNAYRERYTRLRAGWQPATARYEALIRERLGPGTRLLDLGCGRGLSTLLLTKKYGASVFAADL